jgi:hypothetical protein
MLSEIRASVKNNFSITIAILNTWLEIRIGEDADALLFFGFYFSSLFIILSKKKPTLYHIIIFSRKHD